MKEGFASLDQLVKARYSRTVDLGPCLVGRNLNLQTLRGFSTLDKLAVISAPDIYDQEKNPMGTQRALRKNHAEECFEYATIAAELPAEEEPRAFPEVILNVRNLGVAEFYSIDDPSEPLDFNSFSAATHLEARFVGVKILLGDIHFPKPEMAPDVSRVDGNHRLYGADVAIERALMDRADDEQVSLEFPTVPFSLFVGLGPLQEAALFRDINAEHQGMETAHLDSLTLRLHDSEEMKADPELMPLWLADELSAPGRAFAGMIFRGGSSRGLKEQGLKPPLRITTLKSALNLQLKNAPLVKANIGSEPDELLNLIDNYWSAVRSVFPEAWGNRRDFILLQTIGLNGFAEFGGTVLDNAWRDEMVQTDDIVKYLQPIANNISLKRNDWQGVAGAGGGSRVAEALILASSPDAVKSERVRSKLRNKVEQSVDHKLGLKQV